MTGLVGSLWEVAEDAGGCLFRGAANLNWIQGELVDGVVHPVLLLFCVSDDQSVIGMIYFILILEQF